MLHRLQSDYSNKEISFRFKEREISLFLSQALFSSYDIDRGSRLLLTSLSKKLNFQNIHTVLDIGCGVGTLGLALKSRYTDLHISMQDRDALAVTFSRLNAERNGLEDIHFHGGLAFHELPRKSFDLIVSNIPAKVGMKVLRFFFTSMVDFLSSRGTAAVVVVNRISDLSRDLIEEAGGTITLTQHFAGHTVMHFNRAIPPTGPSSEPVLQPDKLEPYFRSTCSFQVSDFFYSLDTVWGEADFDNPPFTARLVVKILRSLPVEGALLFWNPGQGHIPVLTLYHARESGRKIDRIYCAGRNALALEICRHNLIHYAEYRGEIKLLHLPDTLALKSHEERSIQFCIVECEHLAGVPIPDGVFEGAEKILEPGGILIITGKSAHFSHFDTRNRPFSRIAEKKHKGYKVVSLKRL